MNYLTFVFILVTIGTWKGSSSTTTPVTITTTELQLVTPSCNGEECTCVKGYLPSSDHTKCLPYVTEYYGECSEDAQCEWLGENSECYYVCRCKEGYRWYLGQCIKYGGLGAACSETVDCYDGYNMESLTCVDNKCSCSDGYYQRGDTDCRKKALNLDDICALDIDCQVEDAETVCLLGKCRPADDTSVVKYLEEIEVSLAQEFPTKQCVDDTGCASINNSVCYNQTGTCVCQKQYFFDGESCIGELGVDVQCQQDADCPIKPGKCVEGSCYCRDYYFVAEGNQKCVKTISQKNWNCLSTEWCYAFGPYGYCSSSETCKCSRISTFEADDLICAWNGEERDPDMCISDLDCKHFGNAFCVDEACGCKEGSEMVNGTICLAVLGASCDKELLCKNEHSECRDDVCQCTDNYVAFETQECYLKKKLGEECEKHVQCSSQVMYSSCFDGKCECDDDRVEYDGSCYLKTDYGLYCNTRRECSVSLEEEILGDSIECRNHKCQCPTGYTRKDNECSSGTILAGSFIVPMIVLVLNGVLSAFS